MKLYYFDDTANFGDCLNGWLWPRLLPDRWDPADGITFSGIGTIINARMPRSKRWIVFTSGVGYGGPPPGFGDPAWTIAAVRGPLSAAVLGLPRAAAITDGAMLLSTLPEYAALPDDGRLGTVFVPHHEAETGAAWQEVCRRAGIEYLSPLQESREVIRRIGRARLVLAEAMHAAIVADALRVPWLPVVSSPQVSTFKWLDWTRSMDMPYAPIRLPPSTTESELRGNMLWAWDQAHRFTAGGEDRALAYYARRYAARSPARTRLNALGRRLHRRAERALKSPRVAAWRSARDEKLIDRAATAMARTAQSPGLLSEDRVFDARIDALTGKLAGLR